MFKLYWHDYSYFPYERDFALRELKSGLKPKKIFDKKKFILVDGEFLEKKISQLVYFSAATDGFKRIETVQAQLERGIKGKKVTRQHTRYSVHGIHDYKGKFNPQVAKSIMNILRLNKKDTVLDPFCGSGTVLVESKQMCINAIGFDLNPLATFIAESKINALKTDVAVLNNSLKKIVSKFNKKNKNFILGRYDDRLEYLSKWFEQSILNDIELLRTIIDDEQQAPFFLIIASNILRDYSLQDPGDLRIRRRKTPLPDKPFINKFEEDAYVAIANLELAQKLTCKNNTKVQIFHADSRDLPAPLIKKFKGKITASITSPPYAMALPYIDTQRLSIVWLNLSNASEIINLDASLVGSRDFNGRGKQFWEKRFIENHGEIPKDLHLFCIKLNSSLGGTDGFRKKAMPALLYRYLEEMRDVFRNVFLITKKNGSFTLVVGHNKTTIGNIPYDIDTPSFLVTLALSVGWKLQEKVDLQTYRRYGINYKNSIGKETLIILKKPR